MKYKILEWILVLIVTFIISYVLSINSVIAEDKYVTFDSEVTRLAKQYVVSERKARNIISCESANKADAIRINAANSIDWSYWQISSKYWYKEMKDMGWDITNPNDNLEAGFYLLSKYGDKLWYLSKYCWAQK